MSYLFKIHPTPWRLELEQNGTIATVYDANNKWVTLLAELELGWNDVSTGPYTSPQGESDFLKSVVEIINSYTETKQYLNDALEVIEDHKRLVREIDIALNGSNAAQQASLCDILGQIEKRAKEKAYHETKNILDALDILKTLDENYNGYGAQKPSLDAIELAKKFIKIISGNYTLPLKISLGDGGIDLVWKNHNTLRLIATIDPLSTIHISIDDRVTGSWGFLDDIPFDGKEIPEILVKYLKMFDGAY